MAKFKGFSRMDENGSLTEKNVEENLKNTLPVAHNEIKYNADVETYFENVGVIEGVGSELNQVFLNVIVSASHAIKETILIKGR